MKIRPIVIAALFVIAVCSAASGQSVRVPGTGLSLVPPAGFSAARQYSGFEKADDEASIVITELPVASTSMIQSMSGPALATRGMALISARDVAIDAKPARLLHVRQRGAAAEVLKWILITGDAKKTTMVVGTCPSDSASGLGDSIEQSLLTASFRTGPPNPFEGLPFRITPTARLKLAHRVSNMLMFTESGTSGSPGSTEPLFIAGHSIGNARIPDVHAFSDARAKETKLITSLTNITGREITIGGMNAWELEADARDTRSGRPMHLYQVIALDDTGYFILQGICTADRAAEVVPEFRALASSFRITNQ